MKSIALFLCTKPGGNAMPRMKCSGCGKVSSLAQCGVDWYSLVPVNIKLLSPYFCWFNTKHVFSTIWCSQLITFGRNLIVYKVAGMFQKESLHKNEQKLLRFRYGFAILHPFQRFEPESPSLLYVASGSPPMRRGEFARTSSELRKESASGRAQPSQLDLSFRGGWGGGVIYPPGI